MWQRAYDAGRDRGHGRGQVHFTGARCAPVLFGQIRYNEAPEIQVPLIIYLSPPNPYPNITRVT